MNILNYFKSRDNWIVFLLSLACLALLPFADIARGALFILFFILLFRKDKKETIRYYLKSPYKWIFWSCIIFYLLNIIGLAYTPDIKNGMGELGFKFPMIFIPILFILIPPYFFEKKNQKKYLFCYIWGCLLYAFYTLGYAFIRIIENPELFPLTFFKSELALDIHPTYVALFFVMGIVFAYYLLQNINLSKRQKYFLIIIIIFFCIYTMLLSSRGGILALIISGLLMILPLFKTKKGMLYGALILIASFIFLILSFTQLDFLNKRLEGTKRAIELYQTDAEEQDPRIALWRNSISFIKEHFWVGIGTGGKNTAMEDIRVEEYPYLNDSHNQFLQTFIEMGVFGFLSLLSIFISGIILALRKNSLVLLIFLIIFFVNFLFESMLERVLGNTFFMLSLFMILGGVVKKKDY